MKFVTHSSLGLVSNLERLVLGLALQHYAISL